MRRTLASRINRSNVSLIHLRFWAGWRKSSQDILTKPLPHGASSLTPEFVGGFRDQRAPARSLNLCTESLSVKGSSSTATTTTRFEVAGWSSPPYSSARTMSGDFSGATKGFRYAASKQVRFLLEKLCNFTLTDELGQLVFNETKIVEGLPLLPQH